MCYRTLVIAVMLVTVMRPARTDADIYRWDDDQIVLGAEGIEPGPGVMLEHRQLSYAELAFRDLTDSHFYSLNLTRALFSSSTSTEAKMYRSLAE